MNLKEVQALKGKLEERMSKLQEKLNNARHIKNLKPADYYREISREVELREKITILEEIEELLTPPDYDQHWSDGRRHME